MASGSAGGASPGGGRNLRLSPRVIAAVAAGAGSLAIYLATMSRTVGFIDRGELAAVAATLGIAHPTGYPLLTLLGNAVVRLAPAAPLVALNALAALWVATGVSVLVLLYDELLAQPTTPNADPLPPSARASCAALAALATGFSATWWQQANGFEAYALHALLLPLVAWSFVRYVTRDGAPAAPQRWVAGRGAAFAFTLGLSLSNHLTTIVLAPAFLAAFFARRGLGPATWRELAGLVPAFVVGLSPYLYLPLRTVLTPRFSWGEPDSPWRFFSHVTGRQYQVWMFSDTAAAWQQLAFTIGRLPWEWVGLGLALAALGVVSWRRHAGTLAAIGLVAGASVAWACAYAIRDIDPYILPLGVAVGALVAAGLAALAGRFGAPAAWGFGGLCVVLAIGLHWRSCDERGNTLVEDYVRNVLEPLPPGAVLATTQWDYLVSPSYYLQEVARLRPDVGIVDPELMRRSWYVRELARRDSVLVRGFADEAARFVVEIQPFEHARPYDGARIQAAYEAMLAGLARSAQAEGRRMFVSWEVRLPVWQSLERVPIGLVAELRADTGYVPFEPPRYRYRRWEGRRDHYVATMARNYGEALGERAVYEARHGRMAEAQKIAALGLEFAPRFAMKDVPPLPLDSRDLVVASLELFRRLRVVAGGSSGGPIGG